MSSNYVRSRLLVYDAAGGGAQWREIADATGRQQFTAAPPKIIYHAGRFVLPRCNRTARIWFSNEGV